MTAKITRLTALLFGIATLATSPAFAETAYEKENQRALTVLLHEFERAKTDLAKNPGKIAPGEKYVIQSGDSLQKIAMESYGKTALNLKLIKKLMIENNPDAFFRGNEHYLFSGAIIQIPSLEDIKSYVFSGRDSGKYQSVPQSEWIRYP
jgi:Tfp pilus assembly protein FimV